MLHTQMLHFFLMCSVFSVQASRQLSDMATIFGQLIVFDITNTVRGEVARMIFDTTPPPAHSSPEFFFQDFVEDFNISIPQSKKVPQEHIYIYVEFECTLITCYR